MLQVLWSYFKHWVLDLAHPLPKHVRLALGPLQSIERAILQEVVQLVPLEGMEVVKEHTSSFDICIDDSTVKRHHSVLSIARYLGRLWRMYHVDPRNAFVLDGYLDLLGGFLMHAESEDAIAAALQSLEALLEEDGSADPWLGGFDRPTIADACWFGALTWGFEQYPASQDSLAELPYVSFWWNEMLNDHLCETSSDDGKKDD